MITLPEEAEKFRNPGRKGLGDVVAGKSKGTGSGWQNGPCPVRRRRGRTISWNNKEHSIIHASHNERLVERISSRWSHNTDEFDKTTFVNYYRTVNEFQEAI
ncbi:hypothetical protein OS493_025320 [Desmophyllum pertusum]|uniref:Uncharacterized protein n=1 Tax=Desmophyllum pertusum TaxID=174260 RepID=A0A9W9ZBM5_9CNID|nr:hypothetical protein OS493_025320 [Desmophyllum pertusum]